MLKKFGSFLLILASASPCLAALRTHTDPDFNLMCPRVLSGTTNLAAWIDDDGMGELTQYWTPTSIKWTVYDGNGAIVSSTTTNTSSLQYSGGGRYTRIMYSGAFITNGFANGNYVFSVEITAVKYVGMFFQVSTFNETGCFVINN